MKLHETSGVFVGCFSFRCFLLRQLGSLSDQGRDLVGFIRDVSGEGAPKTQHDPVEEWVDRLVGQVVVVDFWWGSTSCLKAPKHVYIYIYSYH